jgi:hypothetical protein
MRAIDRRQMLSAATSLGLGALLPAWAKAATGKDAGRPERRGDRPDHRPRLVDDRRQAGPRRAINGTVPGR